MPFASVATFEDLEADTPTYDRAEVQRIPSRVAGTRVTAELVDQLVRQGVRSPEVAELAEFILTRFGARPHDQLSQIRAIHRALVEGLFYVRDPYGLETLRDGRKLAAKMLRYFHGQGPRPLADCDDFTIAGREILEHIGFMSKSRVIGTKRPGVYNHIFPMARLSNGAWVGIEATIPFARPFFAPASTTVRPMDVPHLAGLGQDEKLSPIEKAAVRVLRETAPITVERTFKPAVEQLREELKFLRWVLLGLTVLAGAGSYFLIRRAPRRAG